LGTLNSFPLIVRTTNVERLRVTPAGSVGIGTATPADKLTVRTPTASYGISHTDGTTTLSSWVGAGSSPATVASGWLGTKSFSPLQFFTGGRGSQMTLATSGNLGIGVTAPPDRLSVKTATNSYGVTHSDGTTTVGSWVGAGSSGIASGWFGTRTNSPLRFFTNNGAGTLNVYPSGEVGIGSYAQFGSKLSSRSSSASVDAGRFDNTTAGRAITATNTNGQAILGRSFGGTSGIGVYGFSDGGTGVYGYGPQWAGYFLGNVNVTGTVFRAQDDPRDPANKTLASAAVGANELLNVFSGNVTTGASGEATVQLPAYFSAAYTDPRYQLTVVGQFAQAIVARELKNNTFTIRTDKPNVKVSWQVTAVRNDPSATAHPFQAEQDKPAAMRGKYYDPQAYGHPATDSVTPTASAAPAASPTP
jgi:hypothetical protein